MAWYWYCRPLCLLLLIHGQQPRCKIRWRERGGQQQVGCEWRPVRLPLCHASEIGAAQPILKMAYRLVDCAPDYGVWRALILTQASRTSYSRSTSPRCLHHSAIMGEQLKFRGQLVAHEDWVTSIAATSEVRAIRCCFGLSDALCLGRHQAKQESPCVATSLAVDDAAHRRANGSWLSVVALLSSSNDKNIRNQETRHITHAAHKQACIRTRTNAQPSLPCIPQHPRFIASAHKRETTSWPLSSLPANPVLTARLPFALFTARVF